MIRDRKEVYLPRMLNEPEAAYVNRCKFAPFVNLFADFVRNVAAKPFSKEVTLQGNDVTDWHREFAEDVDGHGTSMHKFARDLFEECVGMGIVGILVDFPAVSGAMTLAEERNMRPRPYWSWYRPEDVLAMYTETRAGRRYVIHVRLLENMVRRMGFSERPVRRVRILNDDGQGTNQSITWQLWESAGAGWTLLGEGFLDLPEIPFRVVKFGKREWWTNACVPPLVDLARLQIEHYQQSSNLKHVLEVCGFPMLSACGLGPETDPASGEVKKQVIGPSTILYAPAQPTLTTMPYWTFVEPAAHSIKALQDQIDNIETQMAKIGMAPLVRETGGVSATAEAVNSAKAHAAAEAWATDLKDMLEQMWVFTAHWMAHDPEATPQVYIHTDFGIELRENAENSELLEAFAIGALSRETLWDEWARRGFLGPQFDPRDEINRIEQDLSDGWIVLTRDKLKPVGGDGAGQISVHPPQVKPRPTRGNTFTAPPSMDSAERGDLKLQNTAKVMGQE